MANHLIVVFVVLVALTQKSFCTSYFLSSQNDKSTEVPDTSNYGQNQEQEQNSAITEPQSSGYGQNNGGDQGNEAEAQSPGDSPDTEPTSPSGSSDGQGGGKDQVGSGGEDSTHPKDDTMHFPDDDSDENDRWKLIYQYLHPSTFGNGYDDEQHQTGVSGKKSINDQDDNTENQDLGDSTLPSGSSYSQDGEEDQAGSEGEVNTGDQNDGKNDQNNNAEGQELGGADHTEPASPSDLGYGHDGGEDQVSVSGGEDSTNDQDDDTNGQGDNIDGQKTEDSSYPYPGYTHKSSYSHHNELDQIDSGGNDSAKDQDEEKTDQDDNTEDQDLESAHDTEPAWLSGSSYGNDGEELQAGSVGEDSTNNQNDDTDDQGENTEGQKIEDSIYIYPIYPPISGYGYNSELYQTDSGVEGSAIDLNDEKTDQDDNAEEQDLESPDDTESTLPSGSSYGYNGEEDQAGSVGGGSTNDQGDDTDDQGDNVEDQELGGTHDTEPASPSGSSYGDDGEEDQAGSVGGGSTNDQDDDTDDQGENTEGQKIEDSSYLYPVYPPPSGYGYDSELDQTDSGSENSAIDLDDEKVDQDDNAEEQELESPDDTESTLPSGSSYSYDGEEDQAGSVGGGSTNDQDDDTDDQDDNVGDQELGGTHDTEPASPSGSSYGDDGEEDQAGSVGAGSTNDQDDDTDDQGDNTEGQKTEGSLHPFPVYPPSSGYGYDSELDQTDSGSENSAIDLDDEKVDQDDNAEEQDLESPDDTESTLPSGSSYGYDGEEDQAGSVGGGSTNDQDDDTDDQGDNAVDQENVYDEGNVISQSNGQLYQVYHRYISDSNNGHNSEQDQTTAGDEDNIQDQDNNAEGHDQEGSSYTPDSNPGQNHNEEQGQTAATGEDSLEEDNIAYEQPYQSTEDQDEDEDSSEEGVDIAVSDQQVGSVTKFGADNVLLIGERDNMIILNWDGKNVTIGFNSIELAIAMLNNVTLEHQKSSKSSNILFHQMASLLKNSDSKGSHHIISPPLN